MHRFIAICLCLSLIFIAGCSSQPIDKPSENKTDDIQYTETKKYAEDISDHAMSISAQLKLIDKDKGLTYLEQWAKNGNEDALAQGQELIAEGLQEGSSFAKQLNTEILIERQHN